MKVITVPNALINLQEEVEYFQQNYSIDYSIKFRFEFKKIARSLSENYLAYPECRFLQTKKEIYRNIIWNKYLIIYKIMKDEVWILGLFHTSQNPVKLKAFRKIRK